MQATQAVAGRSGIDKLVPLAYCELLHRDGTIETVGGLSIDGAVRLGVSVASLKNATIRNVGSLGGCFNCTEQAALNQFLKGIK